MANSFSVSSATLFNNYALSDITLKQINKDTTREYYAHKAILCKESGFFLKAFTGTFKEAAESSMELHEDDPDLFEFMLKFLYSDHYDKDAIAKLAANDNNKRGLLAIGVYSLADKYDIPKLYEPATEDLKTLLFDGASTQAFLSAIICSAYEDLRIDTPMGRMIVSVVLAKFFTFSQTSEFRKLMLDYPMLAADIALKLQPEKDGMRLPTAFTIVGCNNHACAGRLALDLSVVHERGVSTYACVYCKKVCRIPAV